MQQGVSFRLTVRHLSLSVSLFVFYSEVTPVFLLSFFFSQLPSGGILKGKLVFPLGLPGLGLTLGEL